ncbi:hypothetical protein [uncultured Tateyamaria sp.]|uniref:hypothetical protein n=1 Tax=uncultured Tateyamaria sp. TaxID=455651 RepID=UPI0026270F66|nr:hypothetical protein [uncultured Tateyamaria sp.]
MMFFRPEATAQIWRWREVLVGVALAILALWWLAGPGGLLGLIAPVLLVGAGALIMVGLQRGRFRGAGGGLGTVQVDEGQVMYFGPLSGGAIAMRELQRLTLDGAQRPAHWRLEQLGHPPVMIPVDADGADALFDAFAALPGLKTERMLAQLRDGPSKPVLIWERAAPTLAQMEPAGRA